MIIRLAKEVRELPEALGAEPDLTIDGESVSSYVPSEMLFCGGLPGLSDLVCCSMCGSVVTRVIEMNADYFC